MFFLSFQLLYETQLPASILNRIRSTQKCRRQKRQTRTTTVALYSSPSNLTSRSHRIPEQDEKKTTPCQLNRLQAKGLGQQQLTQVLAVPLHDASNSWTVLGLTWDTLFLSGAGGCHNLPQLQSGAHTNYQHHHNHHHLWRINFASGSRGGEATKPPPGAMTAATSATGRQGATQRKKKKNVNNITTRLNETKRNIATAAAAATCPELEQMHL